MKIEKNKVVSLSYELHVEGEMVDKATSEKPLEFIQGMGYLLPLFEQNIESKEPGDKFAFTLEAKDGYGEWSQENVIDLPKAAFEVDGNIREDLMVVGNIVPLMNPMGGIMPAKVVEVKAEAVTMDLNHPMAGKTLDFTGEILTVRDASEKELKEGLHGEFAQVNGHHECCGGGCHEGGCEGGCHEGGCHEGGCHEGGCSGEGHEGCCNGEGHEGGCCGK